MSYLSEIGAGDIEKWITPIQNGVTWPDSMLLAYERYKSSVQEFKEIVMASGSSNEILSIIRKSTIPAPKRGTFLKIFRRCVCLVLDTEKAKKIVKHPTETLIENYGDFFKPIDQLKDEFQALDESRLQAICALVAEYDTRGQSGYDLTDMFFTWFEENFPDWKLIGPRRAGPDAQLSKHLTGFTGECPCDFIIWDPSEQLKAIGFARYDSTRGGAQADDRTGGNANKVDKMKSFYEMHHRGARVVFLADGPGLNHGDIWRENCDLDDSWGGRVRVTTLKLCNTRITREWLSASL